jgi:PAS domain S-box-containing protein
MPFENDRTSPSSHAIPTPGSGQAIELDLAHPERVTREQLLRLVADAEARHAAEERRREVETLNDQLRQQTTELEMQTQEAQTMAEELEEQAAELEAANLELAESLREAERAREAARRAEAEVRDQAEVLRAVIDESPLVKIVLDSDLRVTRWNRSAERVFGWTAEEMLGESYKIVIPRERWEEHAGLREDAINGRAVMNIETQRRRKDGSLADVSTSVAALHAPDGSVRGFAVVMADISERLRLEARLRQTEKMEAVGQLAGGVAHDFNNLLTVITSYSSLLLGELPAESPLRADVQQIGGAAKRAATLTRQLLAFSRKQVLRPQLLTLNDVVSGVEKLLRRLVREDIAIVTHLHPNPSLVEADPGQLEQVIMNLVVNARDAMPRGGTLTIRTANVELGDSYIERHTEVAVVPGHYAVLSISDTGIGMSRDIQRHIFEPFFTTKGAGTGTGLGLSTVYGIVKQSGGYIWVYSEEGNGTVFKVYLPSSGVEEESASMDRHRTPVPTRITGNESVLVVEDDSALRYVACRSLRSYGYNVIEARNGREALDLCERLEGVIHLVVTDLVMPEMSGSELARLIAARRPGIRILLMSGYAGDDLARQSIVSAGTAFIEKPFTAHALAERVSEFLERE